MKREQTLEQRVLQFIREHRLVGSGETLVAAVSGGPDSVCLLHVLFQLQQALNIKLHLAHLNHQLRSADSEADADYVADLARRLGVPATIEERDVAAYQAQHRLSLEEAAREVRYTFLTQVARAAGASRVAVGHTVDDHLETILMHIIRGTGIRGLRGLQLSTELRFSGVSLTVVRPLLSLSREETAEYCRQHQLAPRLDASNLWLRPLRNRIRLELLPLLKNYNPGVTDALLRLSRIAADDLAFIDEEVARLWDDVAREGKNVIILDKKRFLELPPALQPHLLRTGIEKLLGTLKDIEERHIEEIMLARLKSAGKRLSLPEGLTFAIEYDRYLLGFDLSELTPFPEMEGIFPLRIPGKTRIPGWRVEATILRRGQVAEEAQDNLSACFDRDRVGNTLAVRTLKPGDRFQPLGMNQLKKVGEFMLDARIPHEWRRRIPIVCSPNQIIWVVGWRIDERVKVTKETKQVLCLKTVRRDD